MTVDIDVPVFEATPEDEARLKGRTFIRNTVLRACKAADDMKLTVLAAIMGIPLSQLSSQLSLHSREQLSMQRLALVSDSKFWESFIADVRLHHTVIAPEADGDVQQAMSRLLISLDCMAADLRARELTARVTPDVVKKRRA